MDASRCTNKTLLLPLSYLPPDPEFLSSPWDFPEMFLCLLPDRPSHHAEENFLKFFSGNISRSFCLSSCIFQLKFLILSIAPCSLRARGDNCKLAFHNIMLTLLRPLSYSTSSSPINQVLIANHLYNAKFTRLSISLHCFNWLQAIRLLATRGHYSIDLIIGYVVAVWVSSPAERLGLYYSHMIQPSLPSIVETFEALIGVSETEFRVFDHSQDRKNIADGLKARKNDSHTIQSETSVRIAVDIVVDMARRNRE